MQSSIQFPLRSSPPAMPSILPESCLGSSCDFFSPAQQRCLGKKAVDINGILCKLNLPTWQSMPYKKERNTPKPKHGFPSAKSSVKPKSAKDDPSHAICWYQSTSIDFKCCGTKRLPNITKGVHLNLATNQNITKILLIIYITDIYIEISYNQLPFLAVPLGKKHIKSNSAGVLVALSSPTSQATWG